MGNIQMVDTPPNLPTTDNTENFKTSERVAELCREVVRKTAVKIQGKQYVQVEGWEAIAIAHGLFVGAGDVVREYDNKGNLIGWKAIASIRSKDGVVISTGEGFVGKDERSWGKRDEYACRAMAQTRAISRVCRSTLAHVVVMIDTNLSTTPAEEIPPSHTHTNPPRQPNPPPLTQKQKDLMACCKRLSELLRKINKKDKENIAVKQAEEIINKKMTDLVYIGEVGKKLFEVVNGYPANFDKK